MPNPVVVCEYNPEWKTTFEAIEAMLRKHPTLAELRIEHVGSTSVPGLAAKPVIDMDIIATSRENVGVLIEALTEIGYTHRGDLGIIDREAFSPSEELKLPRHNLYVCIEDCAALRNHLILRGMLRNDDSLRDEYAALKIKLAKEFPDDVTNYCIAKTNFILKLLSKGGMGEKDLEKIRKQNEE